MTSNYLILASKSLIRATLLQQAGVLFSIKVSHIDEGSIKKKADLEPALLAAELARAKAEKVSHLHPEHYVLGCDQILLQGKTVYDKPADLNEAKKNLESLRGKSHQLTSALCVYREGKECWSHQQSALLTMRMFSNAFLTSYLDKLGDKACDSVGGYQLEGIGVQLFNKVDGDYTTILGLPLIPLLEYLRSIHLLNK